jgi:hypothetical protein
VWADGVLCLLGEETGKTLPVGGAGLNSEGTLALLQQGYGGCGEQLLVCPGMRGFLECIPGTYLLSRMVLGRPEAGYPRSMATICVVSSCGWNLLIFKVSKHHLLFKPIWL